MYVVDGSSDVNTCCIDAISWKYTDISTLPSDRVYQLSNGSLVIEEAIEAHSGYYLCHSSNNVGAGLSKVITITVHGK